ncbi:MauE/DoxX family redox-associated membrane protein [Pedobacter cryoconitis]|uniref:MauE/DoxX family redox-associated membrane protein n=1 Tax=Pedobacter cryoconitis TaxID=188932 RepID=UPI00160C0921|nr:MauE/DoxX family redox-associated membrane protein [Pedobacter cryoconitis]MBB5645780.1 hypothetical protein [Pedobacter cryoconitis]
MGTTFIKRTFKFSEVTKEKVIFGICLACIFLFLSSAYSKIADHKTFVQGLSRVSLIGSYAEIIGWLVPLIEITASILLIVPKTYKIGLVVFIWTMSVFSLYILSMLLWAKELPCHCNLIINSFNWVQHVWFNLAFIGIAGLALRISKQNVKS